MEIIKEVVLEQPGWFNWITSVGIPLVVSMMPVVIIYLSTHSEISKLKDTLELEFRKIQKEKTVEKLHEVVVYFATAVLDSEKLLKDKKSVDKMKAKLTEVITYGSKSTVTFAAKMMNNIFNLQGKVNENSSEMMIQYALLVSFLKYDIVGEWISPQLILMTKIKDYDSNKSSFKEAEAAILKKFEMDEIIKHMKI